MKSCETFVFIPSPGLSNMRSSDHCDDRSHGPGEAFLDEPSTDGQPEAVVKEGIQRSCHSFSFTNDRPH